MNDTSRQRNAIVWFARLAAVAVTIGCLVVFVPWQIVSAYLKPLPDTVQRQLDIAIGYDLDGIVVYVDKVGQPPAFYAAGQRDRDLGAPADPHVLFKIGSISKLYVAAASAMLVSEGRLSLDDTLTDHLPALADRIENANRITVGMLLRHRSGIPDWIEDPEFPWTTSFANVEEYLELVLDEPALFEPGERYDYSNTNYLLIGDILDKILGYDHQDYIRERILVPLGLTKTFGTLGDVDPNDVSSGYYIGYDGDVKLLDIVVPGGSMISTAEETGIFLRALNDGSLFDDDEQAIYSSIYEYEHTGLWPGYSSIARYHPDIDAVVIQFVNTSGGQSWSLVEIMYNRVVRILRKHPSGESAD